MAGPTVLGAEEYRRKQFTFIDECIPRRMKPRKHQYLDIGITLLFAGTCIQSALRGSNALDLLSTLSMYTIMSSIFIGLLVTAYVRLKKDQIFDPLSSELDEE